MNNKPTAAQKAIVNDLIEVFDSKFFKTLSEPVRVEILKFIMLNGRADIGTIAESMPQDRSVISRHLNLMSEVGILICKKESRHMFYEINAGVFLEKLQTITDNIRQCLTQNPACCPQSPILTSHKE